MKRDLSHEQFVYRARKMGAVPSGFMGYWKLPCGTSVSVLNAGTRRRAWLSYLQREQNRISAAEKPSAIRNPQSAIL